MPVQRPLTILNIAYPFAPIGRNAVGGAEQVLSSIDRYLTAHGHSSIVIACEGSDAAGTLEIVNLPAGQLTPPERHAARVRYRNVVARVLGSTRVDVIHMHGVDAAEYLPETN